MAKNAANQRAEQKIAAARQSGAKALDLSADWDAKDAEKLSELPESLAQLTWLQSLKLSDNHLTALPEWLCKFSQLQSLDLSHNPLAALPESLGQLSQLQSLDLSYNPLAALPKSLGQLSQLQSLNLRGNPLAALPESLGQLLQLQSLDLAHTPLTALPKWLGQFSQLQSLDLSGNQLAALPESLWQLSQLQSLALSYNQLATLPESLGQLSQLQTLNLSHNQLAALPEPLGQLSLLQSLDLSHNQLATLSESLGQLSQLQSLDLCYNQLAALPESLGQLSQLQSLDLSYNKLAVLPESLGQLSRLQLLELSDNQLTALPESLGQLTQLEELALWENKFTSMPESISRLSKLRRLSFSLNQIASFPDWLCGLANLTELYAIGNQIEKLPENLVRLNQLRTLCLGGLLISWNIRFDGATRGNKLKTLPASLADMDQLERLELRDNPLEPGLAAAYEEGLDAVKRYLRELAKGAKKRYEAKLLILGDGNEGKTCVSRALRGLPFCQQNTTHGVDVVQWTFSHPDNAADGDKAITLNIWDFEGQEISHQTHQFFLSSQSLYLLVFKCRDQFLLDRAEYWLDTIRARAPQAKVALVITQCEQRSPLVPLDRIQAQYGDLLAEEWFFPVGCEDGSNIAKLVDFLQRWAAGLEFMGSPWPMSYGRAETALKTQAEQETAHIGRGALHTTFAEAGISQDNYEDAAAALARLGIITQFPDCPDLRDFIVLRPQWLTKAISRVMEDRQLSEERGEISLRRLEGLWQADYPGLFATFHDCMQEFELCYDLEDSARRCLVPLRFGYLRPAIPWSSSPDWKTRRVEYKLNIRPPMGIMSRFIVKTHHLIVKTPDHPMGVYWHNGVFLGCGEGPLRSEALCEFVQEERKLRVEVRAAYPQNLCEQIHAYLQAVFAFFRGLAAERSYGCIKLDAETGEETPCLGLHTEKRIYTAISRKRPTMDCEFEDHEVDPRLLVGGFGSFSEFVLTKVVSVEQLRTELDKQPDWAIPYLSGIGALLDWASDNGAKLNQLLQGQAALPAQFQLEAENKLRDYLALTSQMLDNRDFTAAPGLIAIRAQDRRPWNAADYFQQTYLLTPYCECPGNIHPSPDGQVPFRKDRAWWAKSAPWIARGTKVLSVGIQLALAGMPLAIGSEAFEAIKDDAEFMDKLAEHMEWEEGKANTTPDAEALDGLGRGIDDKATRLARAALARLLEELAPNNYRARQWGSLQRLRMSDNSYRWLCPACAKRCR